MSDPADDLAFPRRDFHRLSAAALAASVLGCASSPAPTDPAPAPAPPPPPTPAPAPARAPRGGAPRKGLNLLFVFTDQERHFARWPRGLALPAHERLQRDGVRFTRHYASAAMCSPSRSVMLTGLQTADTGVFDNSDVPWQKSLSPTVPTIGHMLRKAGYVTAYKGKWHLARELNEAQARTLFTEEIEKYGFGDYTSPGDMIGHTLGGYSFDHLIGGSAVSWLRRRGQALTASGDPWALFVSFVNPHDVMYFNTDAPGQPVQDTGKLFMRAAPAPDHAHYRATWDAPLPASLREPMDAPGRPRAHGEFLSVWDGVLGHIPPEEERWRRFGDFYLNSIRAVDAQLALLLAELDALGLADRTAIVFTADHGEMAGAHGLRGKGPFAYEEAIHVPLSIVHPDVAGGQDCQALSSHVDLAPTLLALAGVPEARRGELAGRALPGKDLSAALASPRDAGVHAAREAALFTYSALSTNDADLFKFAGEARAAGKDPKEAMRGFKPDLTKRGSVRTVVDGRYKLSRYFAPLDRHAPQTLDELRRTNDLELFDLEADPEEVRNLAVGDAHADLLLAMSAKLEAVIKAEVGVDDGREMPHLPDVTWYLDKADL